MTNAIRRPTAKPWIEQIHAYVPGKSASDQGRPLIKLSANENPLGSSPAAKAAMLAAATGDAARYADPDAFNLREALGRTYDLEAERIVCGTGSGELLYLATQGYAGPGDEVVYVRYGFSLYEIAARRAGATPIVAPDNNYATDIDAVIAALSERTRVVFIANPNNPTGTLASRAEIARLHAALPETVLLVLDQAYAEFLEPDQDDGGIELARNSQNVIITRTFSKIHGLAAERIGWGYGAPDIIATLNRIRGPFNVSGTGQAAAVAALSDPDFVEQTRAHNRQWRQWLADQLAPLGNHGVRVIPGHGNFLLVLFEGDVDAETAYHHLMENGYIVRWLPGQGLPHALRITIGNEVDMRAIASALRNLMDRPA